jgi:Zn ribbon nucleic-acid-binding protein
MSSGRLILFPDTPDSPAPEPGALMQFLQRIGLAGDPLDPAQATYLVGSRFMQLVSFMGCSPYLQLKPPEDGGSGFCHIALLGPFEQPRFLYGANTRPPRCPACSQPIKAWRENLALNRITCDNCGNISRPDELEWRRNAGVGRIFVEIRNIFPGEAVPVDELMNGLREIDGGAWSYFYLQ